MVTKRLVWLGLALQASEGQTDFYTWVPEGSVAGFFVRRHLALELVCGADCSCILMCRAGPGDLEGSRGLISAQNPWKTGPKISSQTAFRHPAK